MATRAAAAVMSAAALAWLGLPALLTAGALVAGVLAGTCWVLASDARCRAGRLADAERRGGSCPLAAPVPDPAPARSRWWRWRRGQ